MTAGAMTKIAAINYFNSIIKRDLIFKVLFVNDVHDELIIEAPSEIIQQESDELQKEMEFAASIFCKKVTIKAVPSIGDHWIH